MLTYHISFPPLLALCQHRNSHYALERGLLFMSEESSLVIFSRASEMLAEATTIQKAKDFMDLALTAKDWAKRKGLGEQAIAHARGYAFDAERRLGELLKQTKLAKGAAGLGRPNLGGRVARPPKNDVHGEPKLSELGITKDVSSRAQFVADLPEEKFAQVRSGNVTMVQAKREIKEAERAAKRAADAERVAVAADINELSQCYATIVIDPPWDWGDEGDNDQLGRAKPDYATLGLKELLALPVKTLSAPDSHVYLWITNRSMPKGFKLLDEWGFRFITILTWPKTSFGMGNYFRGQTEHVLFGVRGTLPLARKDASTLLPSWRRGNNGHSSKPGEFLEFVESCSPEPRLEMFSRVKRSGWTSWGEAA